MCKSIVPFDNWLDLVHSLYILYPYTWGWADYGLPSPHEVYLCGMQIAEIMVLCVLEERLLIYKYTVCLEKKRPNVFFVMSSIKLGWFWWNLVHCFLNKFAAVSDLTWIMSVHYLVQLKCSSDIHYHWVVTESNHSRLDYCNSLVCGIAGNLLQKLQLVQNAAASLVCLWLRCILTVAFLCCVQIFLLTYLQNISHLNCGP